jgi:hypothetical protein
MRLCLVLPRSFGGLPTRQVLAGDGPHPPAQLVTIADRLGAASSSPAVPSTCPKQRSAAVIHGQLRSMPMPVELYDQPLWSGPTVLPKLAVGC